MAFVYAGSVHAPFLFDDIPTISGNPAIRAKAFSFHEIVERPLSGYAGHGRPLPMISFALNHLFGGLSPFGYHLVNIVIHAIAAIILYLLLVETVKLVVGEGELEENPRLPYSVAFWSAAIWALNPLQVLSVTLVCQRMNAMAGLFSVLSLLLYVKGRLASREKRGKSVVVWTFFVGAAISAAMALASKQNAVATPFLVLLYECFFFRLDRMWIRRWLRLAPLMLLFVLALGVFWVGSDPFSRLAAQYHMRGFTVWERLLTEARVVFYYVGIYLLPLPSQTRLVYDYPISTSPISPLVTLLALAGLAACAVVMVKQAGKRPLLVFAMAWWFAQLLVESTVIPLEPAFEYRVYTPSMFLWVPFILMLFSPPGGGGIGVLRKARIPVMVVLVLAYAFLTARRNELMAHPLYFWADSFSKAPNDARTAINYANELNAAGKRLLADRVLKRTLELHPNSPEALHNLGASLAAQGCYKDAEKLVREAIAVRKGYVQAYVTLAAILMDTGRVPEGGVYLQKAWRLCPDDPLIAVQMGNYARRLGDADEAERFYRKALETSNGVPAAAHNLGVLYLKKRDLKKAAAAFEDAVERAPDSPEERYMAGVVAMRMGNYHKAAEFFRDALELNPQFADAEKALEVARRGMGANVNAKEVEALEKALKQTPDDPLLLSRLGSLLLRSGRVDEAESKFRRALELNPDMVESTKGLGDVMMLEKRYPEAESFFVKALREAPDDPVLHHNLASALACQGRLGEAVVQYREALRLKPDYTNATLNLRKAEAELRANERNHR